jgi:hypothetical protein
MPVARFGIRNSVFGKTTSGDVEGQDPFGAVRAWAFKSENFYLELADPLRIGHRFDGSDPLAGDRQPQGC